MITEALCETIEVTDLHINHSYRCNNTARRYRHKYTQYMTEETDIHTHTRAHYLVGIGVCQSGVVLPRAAVCRSVFVHGGSWWSFI